jgi:hypothetical protein
MAITVNGNKVKVSTDHGDAARANADLADFSAAGDKAAWFDGLPAARKAALLKAVLLKLNELERRIQTLEKR